jgi:5-aminopentanamidase
MKIGVFQFAPRFGDKTANLDRIESAIAGADADLVVLPELCSTGYSFVSAAEALSLAEPVPGGVSTDRLIGLCRRRNLFLAAGLAEASEGRVYNSAVLLGPQGHVGTYRKTHLFGDEKRWFSAGDTGFRVWDAGPARIGLMVCFDWIFPESARTLSLLGADILCHPANLVLPYCPDAMITRSIENRVFTVTANRTGNESRGGSPGLRFIGRSQAVGVGGDVLFRMSGDEEGLRLADIDPRLARDKHVTPVNDLFSDRRPEAYRIRSG